MGLTTAKKFLLLTERIDRKPALRTRFTSQSYFVLATILDLIDTGTLAVEHDELQMKSDQPSWPYLSNLFKQLGQAVKADAHLKNALQPITSWDIANQIYDGIGTELLSDGQVERVPFQNNLKQHIIYVPTETARESTKNQLVAGLTADEPTPTAMNLLAIFQASQALQWVITDQQQRQFILQELAGNNHYLSRNDFVQSAADVITQKRFWLDSWLS
ncbi:hypothetical protein [Secundilactobacillus folii]|uniref:Uncharacterized protein n=1 Tax=Secundilactobacillus folii TaxID=2678357 RepID=A0A7X3C366_9LACO|nr:hypothetical protein [Secundilactobacillus folii]MTV82306.1 hypothetical protein [Secundilactobacillus folii]